MELKVVRPVSFLCLIFVYRVEFCLMKVPSSPIQGAVDDSLQMIIGFSLYYSCLLAQRRY